MAPSFGSIQSAPMVVGKAIQPQSPALSQQTVCCQLTCAFWTGSQLIVVLRPLKSMKKTRHTSVSTCPLWNLWLVTRPQQLSKVDPPLLTGIQLTVMKLSLSLANVFVSVVNFLPMPAIIWLCQPSHSMRQVFPSMFTTNARGMLQKQSTNNVHALVS